MKLTINDIKHFKREERITLNNFFNSYVGSTGCATVFIPVIDKNNNRKYHQRIMMNTYDFDDISKAISERSKQRKQSTTRLIALGRLQEYMTERMTK